MNAFNYQYLIHICRGPSIHASNYHLCRQPRCVSEGRWMKYRWIVFCITRNLHSELGILFTNISSEAIDCSVKYHELVTWMRTLVKGGVQFVCTELVNCAWRKLQIVFEEHGVYMYLKSILIVLRTAH